MSKCIIMLSYKALLTTALLTTVYSCHAMLQANTYSITLFARVLWSYQSMTLSPSTIYDACAR